MPQKNEIETESAFKNWINAGLVARIAKHIAFHYPEFDSKAFNKLSSQLPALEMKPRMKLICDFLKEHLPQDYTTALDILIDATAKPAPKVEPLKGFDLWAFTEYVHRYGLKDFDESMKALHEFTQKFTAEFAIRPFLIQEEAKTLKVLHKWTKDPSHHVRRLVSEGSRPRLPWGEQLRSFIKDPTPTIELLEKLKYDDELYVRKSVANHLNDISKDHPAIAIKTAQKWLKEAPAKQKPKIDWIVRHALRTLLKKGHPEALKLLGFENKGKVEVKNLKLEKKEIRIGEHLEFSFDLASTAAAQIMVDYLIHHKKSNGETSPKVFKLTTKSLKTKEVLPIKKKHSFKPVTTRVYYPGTHYLEIMVNGKLLAKVPFNLKK
ncbi:DNA alkylation repair protein [Bdellovibrio sp. BCCA]|uniref:DNA alkylation repair protein n=1 Tax=Bdellovibrio sp. BCCA TaxID=3136281 RepID=UPI0030F20ED8